jgi:hypothetical protein
MFTAVISLAAAAYCFRLIPVIISLPSRQHWIDAVQELERYREMELWRRMGKPKVPS